MSNPSAALPASLVEDVLAALEISPAPPGPGLLQALFSRFNARVPFENATKILRNFEVAEPEHKPRTPPIFWADHLAHGTGGTCFARVAAFEAFLAALGFSCRLALGRVRQDFDHAALLVDTPAGPVLADVGFPLSSLLPARAGLVETPLHDLNVAETERGWRIAHEGGVPEGPRELEIFAAEVSAAELDAKWRETFRPQSTFLGSLVMRADRGERAISFARGELRVDDRHTRLTVPLSAPRSRSLSDAFGVDESILARAFEISGDPAPSISAPTLAAYLEVSADPGSAFEAIASIAGYRRLLEGIGGVVVEEEGADRFRLAVAAGEPASSSVPGPPAPGAALSETVGVNRPDRSVSVVREGAGSRTAYTLRVLSRAGKTWLVREAAVTVPADALLRNDSLRGRLAGTFAADLLGWARLL